MWTLHESLEEGRIDLTVTIGGITYYVDCFVVDNRVSEIMGIKVWLGVGNIQKIEMSKEELYEFLEKYEDELNDTLIPDPEEE